MLVGFTLGSTVSCIQRAPHCHFSTQRRRPEYVRSVLVSCDLGTPVSIHHQRYRLPSRPETTPIPVQHSTTYETDNPHVGRSACNNVSSSVLYSSPSSRKACVFMRSSICTALAPSGFNTVRPDAHHSSPPRLICRAASSPHFGPVSD